MAYMDEMALEREKSKQAMIAGKTPMFGADTTAAMHQLGISLGVIPPGTPPSQTTQVLEGLLKGGPGKVKVDEATPLKVQPLVGQLHASLQPQHTGGDEYGNILGGVGAATTNALQRLQQQRQQGPVGPASSSAAEPPGTNRARLSGRAPRAPEGPTYQADLAYLQARGGHHSVLQDGKIVNVPLTQAGSYKALDPELAARLRAAGETYEKENPGKQAKFGEFSRGNDVQKIYYDKVQATGQGKAAPPGASGHQIGMSGDLPPGEFRDWMYKGGQDRHGLHFPVKGDAPHVEVNPANKQSYSNPAAATPGAAPTAAPAADAQPRQGGSAVLAEQRKPVAQYLDSNPSAKEQMAAAAYTEDNNSREGRIAVHEAAANRIVANGRPVSDVIDPKYYQAMNDPAQRTKYDAALQKVKTDPEFRKQLFGEIDQAHKRGTNYAKLATDFASGTSADKSRTNSTSVGKVGGNEFFIKDQHPEVHGAGTVTNNKKWQADTQAALANAKPAAAPTATAQASPAPAAETPKPAEPTAPQASPQLGPSGEEPLQPEPTPAQNTPPSAPPAPVAVPSTPAPAAAAPVPPPVAAPPVTEAAKPAPPAPPPKPAAPPVNPAHAILDTKIGDLVKRGGTPAQAAQVPGWIANKTLREGMNMPVVGGQIAAGVEPYFGKMGITKQQFDQAVKEGPPKAATLGKRSDLGTSDATDFSSRGRTPAPAAAPEAAPAQSSAPAPGEQVPLPQPDPRTEQQPQITPGIAKALENVFKAEEQAPAAPPSAGAMPVLPGQPVAPTPGQGNGGLSLAPAGLSSIPTGALPTGAPGSQGGGIAMAGMLPPIQNSTYSTPLLDQTAATAGSGMGLSPIPLQTLGSWGWGGGSIGAGLDWGGGAPEVPIGVVGGFD